MQRILVVDDEEEVRQLLKKGLENNKYSVITAAGGNEALEICKVVKPDLILLDIMMPEVDGYQVCKSLKENEPTRDIPVIFLTAKDLEPAGIRELYTQFDARVYIPKPTTIEEVLQKVRGVIG